jgi:uncharacterized protein (TIGR02453 family)|tara:strand:- start:2577 stop:3248 length:672 start_codon:yes stop_codon:yes gene_type:complete
MAIVPKHTFTFLNTLKANNNREWFEANKPDFKEVEGQVKKVAEQITTKLNEADSIDKTKLFRIYRDVRFSKDKTPYKTHFAIAFHREKPHLRGGYYLRIRPGESFIAAGFWDPEKDDLFRIRKELEADVEEYRKHTENPEFKAIWGDNKGECVKTAPKGFSKDHANIEWIRYKQHLFTHSFTDNEVLQEGFTDTVNECFQVMRPFFDYMSNILTTDLNGESLI